MFFDGDDLDDGLDAPDDLFTDSRVSLADSFDEVNATLVNDLLVKLFDEVWVVLDQIADEFDSLLSDFPGIFGVVVVVVIVVIIFFLV